MVAALKTAMHVSTDNFKLSGTSSPMEKITIRTTLRSTNSLPQGLTISVTPASPSSPSCTARVLSGKTTPRTGGSPVAQSKASTSESARATASSPKSACIDEDTKISPLAQAGRRNSGHIVTNANRPTLLQRGHQFGKSGELLAKERGIANGNGSQPCVGIQLLKPATVTAKPTMKYVEEMQAIAMESQAGLLSNIPPIPVDDCTGGVYYLRTKRGRIAAVFKPADEEAYAPNNPKRFQQQPQRDDKNRCSVGIRTGIFAGDSAIREVAVYLLDKNHAASVPMTSLVSAFHSNFHYADKLAQRVAKTGSLQVYVPHKCTADDVACSVFSTQDVHSIAILDIRLANQDRHGGNLLVVEQSPKTYKLIPIDHGACLPRVSAMEETSFLWLFWPQAKQPFSRETIQYIASLDATKDTKLLHEMLPSGQQLEWEAMLTLHICTIFLQTCAVDRKMTAYEIGMLMCRHGSFHQQDLKPSVLEQLVTRSLNDATVMKISSIWKLRKTTYPNTSSTDDEKIWTQYVSTLVASFQRYLAAYFATSKTATDIADTATLVS